MAMLEIPAGEIREFASIFDTIRREVKDEIGLDFVKIKGEDEASNARGYTACLSEIYPSSREFSLFFQITIKKL